jgi:hypothetical protein
MYGRARSPPRGYSPRRDDRRGRSPDGSRRRHSPPRYLDMPPPGRGMGGPPPGVQPRSSRSRRGIVVQCSCSSLTISSRSNNCVGSLASSGVAFPWQPYSSLPACSMQLARSLLTLPLSLLAASILCQPLTQLTATHWAAPGSVLARGAAGEKSAGSRRQQALLVLAPAAGPWFAAGAACIWGSSIDSSTGRHASSAAAAAAAAAAAPPAPLGAQQRWLQQPPASVLSCR